MTDPVGPPPPLDRECVSALMALGDALSLGDVSDVVGRLRAVSGGDGMVDDVIRERGYSVVEQEVPSVEGGPEVSLVVCLPSQRSKPAGLVYYVHGGGMVSGSSRSGLLDVIDLAAPHGLAVVSVDYRLAPEHPDPAPLEDGWSGLVWATGNARSLGFDADRVLLVGVSAGGGIAAGLALMARDRGQATPAGLMLLCPMLDDRGDTVSARQMADTGPWNRAANLAGWVALLGAHRGGADVSPYASPARATDLAGLPSTFIDVGSAEIFRDESVGFASRIWASGGAAELHVWPGGYHGYDLIAPNAAISIDTRGARRDWLLRWVTSGATKG